MECQLLNSLLLVIVLTTDPPYPPHPWGLASFSARPALSAPPFHQSASFININRIWIYYATSRSYATSPPAVAHFGGEEWHLRFIAERFFFVHSDMERIFNMNARPYAQVRKGKPQLRAPKRQKNRRVLVAPSKPDAMSPPFKKITYWEMFLHHRLHSVGMCGLWICKSCSLLSPPTACLQPEQNHTPSNLLIRHSDGPFLRFRQSPEGIHQPATCTWISSFSCER